jgi:hypothetical protein
MLPRKVGEMNKFRPGRPRINHKYTNESAPLSAYSAPGRSILHNKSFNAKAQSRKDFLKKPPKRAFVAVKSLKNPPSRPDVNR